MTPELRRRSVLARRQWRVTLPLGVKVQTWPYAHGRAQQTYVWLKRWTFQFALIRRMP